jgi:hypothetical protein
VDTKPTPDILGLSSVKSGNYGKHITVQQWVHSWTPCLTTVAMAGDVTVEGKQAI